MGYLILSLCDLLTGRPLYNDRCRLLVFALPFHYIVKFLEQNYGILVTVACQRALYMHIFL